MGKALMVVHDLYQDDNQQPLGLLYLASMLEQAGHEVEFYCMDVYHYTNDELSAHLHENTYDLICTSFLAARYTETVKPLCKVINEHKKNAWLVLGGHGASPIARFVFARMGKANSGISLCLFKVSSPP